MLHSLLCCIQWLKDTNLKANHNIMLMLRYLFLAVFNGSKILIWKQITTVSSYFSWRYGCIQWLKDTNLKANHNSVCIFLLILLAVFNGSKILIWKQITTFSRRVITLFRCIQWLKDTNLKANHNHSLLLRVDVSAVFNGSKILIWKQITTVGSLLFCWK